MQTSIKWKKKAGPTLAYVIYHIFLFLRCLSCQCCCLKTLQKLLGGGPIMHMVALNAETANEKNKKKKGEFLSIYTVFHL